MNPLFQQLAPQIPGGGMSNFIQQFKQFRQQMGNCDPRAEVEKLLQSGRISQDQLNQAQQMAQQLQGYLR